MDHQSGNQLEGDQGKKKKHKFVKKHALHFGQAGALGHEGLTCSGHAGHAGEPPASRYEASAPTPKATADTTSSEVYLSDSQRGRENSTGRKVR